MPFFKPNIMKRGHVFQFLLLLLMAAPAVLHAQADHPLTLEDCYRLARQNYPLIKEKELIASTRQYSVDNAAKGYLPQFGLNGQVTYQSDVTEIPFKVPGFDIPTVSKTQYKINGTLNQTIYDGGNIHIQKIRRGIDADIQDQSLEVQLYSLKDRINQLYFGILLFTEQIKQNSLQQEDLKVAVQATQAAVDNGSGFRRALDEARVELLNSEQAKINLQASRKAYLDVLGLFVGRSLGESTTLDTPPEISSNSSINRPELRVYDLQKSMYDIEQKQLSADLRPKFSAFVEGGYSLPGLNFLKTNAQWYYIGGLKLNWSL
jgi:outer membrane protein TolC